MTGLQVSAERILADLAAMARFGAMPAGGVRRLAATDEDRAARDAFAGAMRAVGCQVRTDAVGNQFALRPGRQDGPAIAFGSHLDSQPTGGRFDGVLGVVGAMEVMRVLDDHGSLTNRPLAAVAWTNEEGHRFVPAMLGSAVYTGSLALQDALDKRDTAGLRLGDELARIGYAGDLEPGILALDAYLELHIEQGPVLEGSGQRIGAVEGALGMAWYDVSCQGQEAHAGPTPMMMRQDAVRAAALVIEAVHKIALQEQPEGRGTCGVVEVPQGSRNVVAGGARLTVDLRHAESGKLGAMRERFDHACIRIAVRTGVEIRPELVSLVPPTSFDSKLTSLIETVARHRGLPCMRMVSGAGHDAVNMAGSVPTAMVFVPSCGGISHNEAEYTSDADVVAGCQVLLDTVLVRAGLSAE